MFSREVRLSVVSANGDKYDIFDIYADAFSNLMVNNGGMSHAQQLLIRET